MKFSIAISKEKTVFKENKWLWAFTSIFFLLWISTYIETTDLSNWYLENTLTAICVVFLITTYKRYQFSDLSYLLIFLYLCLHVYGAKHSYAENPLGFWIQEQFHSSRNHYDRIVHFSFGFLLAYPLRELFLRWLKYPAIVAWVLPIEITLSIGGLYELIEWGVADVFFKEQGPAYLGTQGDIWDAQKDIFLAFSGAILATTIVSFIKNIFNVHEAQ